MRTFLVVLVLSWIGGIVTGVVHPSTSSGQVLFILGVLVIGGVSWRLGLQWPVTGAAGLVFALGAVHGQGAGFPVIQTCALPARLEALVVERPKITAEYVDYVVRTEEECRFVVRAPRWPLYPVGSRLEVTGEMQSVRDIPEQYAGYAQYLDRQDIQATVRWAEVVSIDADSVGWPWAWRDSLQQRIQQLFPEPTGSFVVAMLLAERGMLPLEIQEQFQRTGVSHILAISGLNISLLAGGLVLLCLLFLPLPASFVSAAVIGVTWWYVFLVGAPLSGVRAAWFWTLTLLFWRRGWLVSLPTVLLLTLVSMLSFDPRWVLDVGFQLSASAVVGIGLALFLARRWSAGSGFGRLLRSLILVTGGATLVTWPLVAYHFGIVSLVSLAANALVVPLVPPVMVLSLAAIGLGAVWTLPSLFLAWVVHFLFWWMRWVTGLLAGLPGAYITNVVLPGWMIVGYYVVLAGVSMIWLRRQGRVWREAWG